MLRLQEVKTDSLLLVLFLCLAWNLSFCALQWRNIKVLQMSTYNWHLVFGIQVQSQFQFQIMKKTVKNLMFLNERLGIPKTQIQRTWDRRSKRTIISATNVVKLFFQGSLLCSIQVMFTQKCLSVRLVTKLSHNNMKYTWKNIEWTMNASTIFATKICYLWWV